MKTPGGRSVYIDMIRHGYFQFRCQGMELILKRHSDGKASIHCLGQESDQIPIYDNWKEAEKAAFDIFDSAKRD